MDIVTLIVFILLTAYESKAVYVESGLQLNCVEYKYNSTSVAESTASIDNTTSTLILNNGTGFTRYALTNEMFLYNNTVVINGTITMSLLMDVTVIIYFGSISDAFIEGEVSGGYGILISTINQAGMSLMKPDGTSTYLSPVSTLGTGIFFQLKYTPNSLNTVSVTIGNATFTEGNELVPLLQQAASNKRMGIFVKTGVNNETAQIVGYRLYVIDSENDSDGTVYSISGIQSSGSPYIKTLASVSDVVKVTGISNLSQVSMVANMSSKSYNYELYDYDDQNAFLMANLDCNSGSTQQTYVLYSTDSISTTNFSLSWSDFSGNIGTGALSLVFGGDFAYLKDAYNYLTNSVLRLCFHPYVYYIALEGVSVDTTYDAQFVPSNYLQEYQKKTITYNSLANGTSEVKVFINDDLALSYKGTDIYNFQSLADRSSWGLVLDTKCTTYGIKDLLLQGISSYMFVYHTGYTYTVSKTPNITGVGSISLIVPGSNGGYVLSASGVDYLSQQSVEISFDYVNSAPKNSSRGGIVSFSFSKNMYSPFIVFDSVVMAVVVGHVLYPDGLYIVDSLGAFTALKTNSLYDNTTHITFSYDKATNYYSACVEQECVVHTANSDVAPVVSEHFGIYVYSLNSESRISIQNLKTTYISTNASSYITQPWETYELGGELTSDGYSIQVPSGRFDDAEGNSYSPSGGGTSSLFSILYNDMYYIVGTSGYDVATTTDINMADTYSLSGVFQINNFPLNNNVFNLTISFGAEDCSKMICLIITNNMISITYNGDTLSLSNLPDTDGPSGMITYDIEIGNSGSEFSCLISPTMDLGYSYNPVTANIPYTRDENGTVPGVEAAVAFVITGNVDMLASFPHLTLTSLYTVSTENVTVTSSVFENSTVFTSIYTTYVVSASATTTYSDIETTTVVSTDFSSTTAIITDTIGTTVDTTDWELATSVLSTTITGVEYDIENLLQTDITVVETFTASHFVSATETISSSTIETSTTTENAIDNNTTWQTLQVVVGTETTVSVTATSTYKTIAVTTTAVYTTITTGSRRKVGGINIGLIVGASVGGSIFIGIAAFWLYGRVHNVDLEEDEIETVTDMIINNPLYQSPINFHDNDLYTRI